MFGTGPGPWSQQRIAPYDPAHTFTPDLPVHFLQDFGFHIRISRDLVNCECRCGGCSVCNPVSILMWIMQYPCESFTGLDDVKYAGHLPTVLCTLATCSPLTPSLRHIPCATLAQHSGHHVCVSCKDIVKHGHTDQKASGTSILPWPAKRKVLTWDLHSRPTECQP